MTISRVPQLLGVQISMTIFALIVVSARLYTRKYIRHIFDIEDWIVAFSMVLAIASMTATCYGTIGGMGLHHQDIPPNVDQSIAAATSFVNQVLYQPILQTTKISMLLFCVSCFGPSVRKQCTVLIAFSIVFCVLCTMVVFLQCRPTSMLWTGKHPTGYKCINQQLFFEVTGIINLTLDFVALMVPMPMIWNLQTTRRTKIALSLVFSVGLLSIGAELIRLVEWFNTSDGYRQNPDPTWNRVPIVNWSTIECTTGLICVSLPHLKALVKTVHPNVFRSTQHSLYKRPSGPSYLKSQDTKRLGPQTSSSPSLGNSSPSRSSANNQLYALGSIMDATKSWPSNESEEHMLETLYLGDKP